MCTNVLLTETSGPAMGTSLPPS
jgi:hypothetical protein